MNHDESMPLLDDQPGASTPFNLRQLLIFLIPSLLGGSDTLMIGKVLWEEFFSNRDWPVASAVAIVLLLILIVPIVLFQRNEQKAREAEG